MQRLPSAPQRPPSVHQQLPQRPAQQQQMNRQPQQPRPPNLAPAPGLSSINAGAFRSPAYAQYGAPPRGMMPYPAQQQAQQQAPSLAARQTPGIHPSQAAPGFNPSRGGFPLASQQVQQQAPVQQQQQQQQPQNAPPSLSHPTPPHLTAPPNLSGTPGPGNNGSDALDPNDFPALGSTNNNASSNPNASYSTSYASQAGNLQQNSGAGAVGSGGLSQQARDFAPEDFPALGAGGGEQGGMNGNGGGMPQGLTNEQHRQNLLGGLVGGVRGMTEAEKRQQQQYALKLASAQNTPQQQQGPYGQQGQQSQPLAWAQQGQNQPPNNQTPSVPNFPPNLSNGMQPPPGYGQPQRGQTPHPSQFQQPQQLPQQQQQQQAQQQAQQQPIGEHHHTQQSLHQHHPSHHPAPPPNLPPPHHLHHSASAPGPHIAQGPPPPQSSVPSGVRGQAAEQLFSSAADRWGLLAIVRMIRDSARNPDTALLSVGGVDLATGLNLPLGQKEELYPTFYSPYSVPGSPPPQIEPDFTLPSCYNVQAGTPQPGKVQSFSDETLFFMFYSSPKDVMQEMAAQELYNRHWRYHKDLQLWVTKEPEYNPPHVVPPPETELINKRLGDSGEKAVYTFWDVETWDRQRREEVVMFSCLEERTPGQGLSAALAVAGTGGGGVAGVRA